MMEVGASRTAMEIFEIPEGCDTLPILEFRRESDISAHIAQVSRIVQPYSLAAIQNFAYLGGRLHVSKAESYDIVAITSIFRRLSLLPFLITPQDTSGVGAGAPH